MQTLETFAPPAAADYLSDPEITAAIELFFLTKKGVPAHLIDVATHDGIVQLTGITDNMLAADRAEEIALAMRGVRGVVNELLISTPDMPNDELHRAVAEALAADPATTGYNVACTVAEGVVTPTGVVQSWAEQQLVLRVLRGVRGVRRLVADELTIRWGEIQNSDEEISTQIRELLDWDIRVFSNEVVVRTNDRVVHLSGTVGTAAERAQVIAVANQTGAIRVDALDLFVAYWAISSELRREKFAQRSDTDIAQAVCDTFRYDPRVLSYQPVVVVQNGVVTLTGQVSSLRAKQSAERDARHVVGVWAVHNLLKVRTRWFTPDVVVRQSILDALARDPYVGVFGFEVRVTNGRAHLHGQVNSHFEQAQAAEVASGVNGVAEVENLVRVLSSTGFSGPPAAWYPGALRPAAHSGSDFALAERIRTLFFWSASLHNQDVAVRVENGRATLSGTVDTWLDREQAAFNAYEAGATSVDNALELISSKFI
ncbi:BON domain-containing protein [Hymenobacter nivis]|uniref:BON domain-containing protein n=1 Tax=Hymenobacter nivis TaxID=1850093 RepID=A0A502G8N7_9BACT|nr:BON domain-containing protein [Hymenobacter nivis]TPG57992.1 BON domain-containing protein [Hymenobacter nivis]